MKKLLLLAIVLLLGIGWVQDKTGLRVNEKGAASPADIAQLARDAGFPEATIQTAVDKAKCESGLNPKKLGDGKLTTEKWGPSVGIWQIRSTWEDTVSGGLRSAILNLDPKHNAKAAFDLSAGGTDWHLWSC